MGNDAHGRHDREVRKFVVASGAFRGPLTSRRTSRPLLRALLTTAMASFCGCATSGHGDRAPSPLTAQKPATPPAAVNRTTADSQANPNRMPVIGDLVQPTGLMSPVRAAAYEEELNRPAAPPTPVPPQGGPNNESAVAAAQGSPLPRGEISLGPGMIAALGTMPIDLPTALRLVDANSPTIALSRARVQEAFLRQRDAELAWLPDLRAGTTYNRHDGRDQNSNGTIFEVSKQNLFVGGGAVLDWNTSEIIFGRLTAERLTAAAQASARAVDSDVQLDVAISYLDLLEVYGEYAITVDAVGRAEEMLRNAESAEQAGLSKTTADINRARTEVDLRRERLVQLQARAAVVSARLARLLLLRPTVILSPIDPRVLPVGLVPDLNRIDDLVAIGLSTRPELQQDRALIGAAVNRWRQSEYEPLIPHLGLTYRGGTFGGGINDQMDDFGARSDGTAEAIWELRNFGAGNIIQNRIRRTQVNEANLNLADVQARVAEEIAAAARTAEAAQRSMEFAQAAVVQALETWRRLREASFGLAGAEHQYDPLQPLIALRDLADARTQYLRTVIEYNRQQFRLYWAMGQPPLAVLPKLPPQATQTPVVPGPYSPKPEEVPAPRQNPGA